MRKQIYISILLTFMIAGGYVLSFLSPTLIDSGGKNMMTLPLAIFLSLLLLIIGIKSARDAEKKLPQFSKLFLTTISLLVVFFIISILSAFDTNSALLSSLIWITACILVISAAVYAYSDKDSIRVTTYALVASGVFLGILGISDFIHPMNPSYLRFTSVLYEHNAYAGFLLIPLILSLGLALMSQGKKERVIMLVASVFLLATFILTFSRGAWLSFILAFIIAALVFRKKIQGERKSFIKRIAGRGGVIILGTMVITGGLFLAAHEYAASRTQAIGVYNGEIIPASSTFDRLRYFKDALRMIQKYPFGVGLDNYNLVSQAMRETPKFFSFNPHNMYLEITAETGIIGGILFIAVLILLLFPVRSLYKKNDAHDPLIYFLFIAIVAALIHGALELDYMYALNIFTLFLALGIWYGSTFSLHNPEHASKKYPPYIVAVLSIGTIIAIASVILFVANSNAQDGLYYQNKGKDQNAIASYHKALSYDPLFSDVDYNLSKIYFNQSQQAVGTQKTADLNRAREEILNAQKYQKNDSHLYYALSQIDLTMGNIPQGTTELEQAVKFDPMNNINKHEQLAELYFAQKRYSDVVTLASNTIAHFPPELFRDVLWSDPSKPVWEQNILTLHAILSQAYINLAMPAQAEATKAHAKLYPKM